MKILASILSLFFLTCSLSAKPVLISFDGSGDLKMWEETTNFANANHVKLTYFISAPYFVPENDLVDHPYWAIKEIGQPFVKFRKESQKNGIVDRFDWLAKAHYDGHEIASHLCGHYDGTNFTYDQWVKELEFFRWTFERHAVGGTIVGIRAPYLGVNAAYFRAIKTFGYKYDSSKVYSKQSSTYYDKEMPIRGIKVDTDSGDLKPWQRYSLPFDYNFSLIHLTNGQALSALVEEELQEEVFFNSLVSDYSTGDQPLQICLHFKTFPGQPYMKAMKRFVAWAKDKNPTYLTYREYLKL